MYRCLMVVVALALSGCQPELPRPATLEAAIIQHGVYRNVHTEQRIKQPMTAVGVSSIGESALLYAGDKVTVERGQGVGFDYVVHMVDSAMGSQLRIVIQHPEIMGADGVAHRVSSHYRELPPRAGSFKSSQVYFFNEPAEMVPGRWTLSIYHQDRQLLARTFNVAFRGGAQGRAD